LSKWSPTVIRPIRLSTTENKRRAERWELDRNPADLLGGLFGFSLDHAPGYQTMRPRSASYPNPADLLGGSFGFSLDLSPTPRVPPARKKEKKGGRKGLVVWDS
jgi:hypothetical protein